MKKPQKESQVSEPHDSLDFQIAEEIVEDEPHEQGTSDSQVQGDPMAQEISEETKNETSVRLTGSANCEKGQILQPKVEQREESKQNVSEELTGAAGMKHESVFRDCENQSAVQATTQTRDDAATEKLSEPSQTTVFRFTVADIVEKVMSDVPAERTTESSKMAQKATEIECNEEIAALVEEDRNVPGSNRYLEAGRESKQGKQFEQELPIQEAQQSLELVLEEAAICDARQKQMEEAEDIEEPQKYAFREKDCD